MTENYQCKICNNAENNQVVVAREMQLGFRDEFMYFKCAVCGCLQIIEQPKNLDKYYPNENYYSYQFILPNSKKIKFEYHLKRLLFDIYWYLNLPLLGLHGLRHFIWLKTLRKITKKSAILDVGCGNAYLLQKMSIVGFKNLTGIDPFIEKDILNRPDIKIFKTDIYGYLHLLNSGIEYKSINKTFELIMLHHSFEHMDNPRETLNQLYQLLAPEGQLLIRIPVSDSFAWRKYGSNWYQLDAPRHFFLHTTKSMSLLAKECGFVLKRVIYDSTELQFLHSEQYSRDLTLHTNVEISPSYIKKCKKQAALLNELKDGDQACFVLEKQQNNINMIHEF
jgi:SAM-dependent methyltransferase